MKNIILFLILISAGLVFSQKKSDFDTDGGNKSTASFGKTAAANSLAITKDISEITLIEGGYYTIGTNSGKSSSTLDDDCQITYGHPYALTSYPLFSVDGEWYKPDEFFPALTSSSFVKGDSLITIYEISDLMSFEFIVSESGNGDSVTLSSVITNLDTVQHNFGLGFTMDPALGKWGDGHLLINETPVETETILTGGQNIEVWEKNTGAAGIGYNLLFTGNAPDKIVAANWNNTYQDNNPEYDNSLSQKIYDLYLKTYWDEEEIDSAGTKTAQMKVSLITPDFSGKVFSRWEIPSYLEMDEGLMFPRQLDSYLQVINTSQNNIDAVVQLKIPDQLSASQNSVNVFLNNSKTEFVKIGLDSKIIYEDLVVEVGALILENDQVIDSIRKNIFIPQTPVSDTGLTVSIDSVDASSFPQVKLFFETTIQSSGIKIANLGKENVFLYDNSSPVQTFGLGKDTTGGVNSVDFVFILDVTGSMGNEIDAVKNNIIEFADSLNYRGVDYRLGMVTFLDEIENIYPFTTDVQLFQDRISQQYAHGGGDGPENSLQALIDGSNFSFRPSANKIMIWITDADYHEQDGVTPLSKSEVIDALLSKQIRVHAIGSEYPKSSYYDPITNATGGDYYNIYGNFRDIFLDISRLKSSTRYILSFESNNQTPQIVLEIRYAGLGGEAAIDLDNLSPSPSFMKGNYLSFYPNPFNPEITFKVRQGNFSNGKIEIFNILGQNVKTLSFSQTDINTVKWNVNNESISSGFYIVRLLLSDGNQIKHSETAKILYLK